MTEEEKLESEVQNEVSEAIKELQKENMTAFLLRVNILASHVDGHIVRNCTENIGSVEAMKECIKKANTIRVKSLNKLGEMLVEKCGGKMIYLKEY